MDFIIHHKDIVIYTAIGALAGAIGRDVLKWFGQNIFVLSRRCWKWFWRKIRNKIRGKLRYVHKPFSKPAKIGVSRWQRLKCQMKWHPNNRVYFDYDNTTIIAPGIERVDQSKKQCEDCGTVFE